MKKFITNVLLFSFTFGAATIPAFWFVSSYDNTDRISSTDENIMRLQLKSKFDSLDVLFIGNSYCYSGIDISILDSLGIKSFNLGIATAGVDFYELIMVDYLDQVEVPPQNVFILVSPMSFTSKADNFLSYPIHRYLEEPKSLLSIALKYERLNQLNLLYKKSLLKGFNNLRKDHPTRLNSPAFNGFFPSGIRVNNEVIQKDRRLYLDLKDETLNPEKLEALMNLAQMLKERQVNVVFFELPTYLLMNYLSPSYLNDYNKYLSSLAKDFPLFRVDPGKFETSNFRNIDHMNTSGASISTLQVAEYILMQDI